MNIERIIKQIENALNEKSKIKEFELGTKYAKALIESNFKYKKDCQFYGFNMPKCKKCEYICNFYQEKTKNI